MEGSNLLIPNHVAFIMDGNGRWASKRRLSRSFGHEVGVDKLREMMEYCAEFGIKIVTAYTLSTENLDRPKLEINALMRLIRRKAPRLIEDLHKMGAQIRHLGRREGIEDDVLKIIDDAVELTKNNTEYIVALAFNYSGREEIIDAVAEILALGLNPEDVTEDTISRFMYCSDLPEPDLVIRSGGEQRLSNFLLWETANSVFYVTDVYWPDLGRAQLIEAIELYTQDKKARDAQKDRLDELE